MVAQQFLVLLVQVRILVRQLLIFKVFKVLRDLKDFNHTNHLKKSFVMGELVRHSGNYKELLSYQKADAIFQLTYFFCHKYLQQWT